MTTPLRINLGISCLDHGFPIMGNDEGWNANMIGKCFECTLNVKTFLKSETIKKLLLMLIEKGWGHEREYIKVELQERKTEVEISIEAYKYKVIKEVYLPNFDKRYKDWELIR